MMVVRDSHPLSEFLRDTETHLTRLTASGNAELLTVDGLPKLVVQDAKSYQALLDEVETIRLRDAILEGEKAVSEGRTRPASEVAREMKAKYAL